MTSALYAFSGDPITNGHIDIIERARRMFDNVIVGIGVNPDKKSRYMFTLEERADMAEKSLAHIPNVVVRPFRGLAVDFAYEQGVSAIVKGIRFAADYDYETILHEAGTSQKLGIETVPLFARPTLRFISSSTVKGMQQEHADIHELVPMYVKKMLESRVSGQYKIGVTGEIGAGKSFFSAALVEAAKTAGLHAHHIDLDKIAHDLYSRQEPAYVALRQTLAKTFGGQVLDTEGVVDRKALGEIVFADPDALARLNALVRDPMKVRLRQDLLDKKGLIVIEAALFAEGHWSYLTNNTVVVLSVDAKLQSSRLKLRGLDDEKIERRLSTQYTAAKKISELQKAIDASHYGKVIPVESGSEYAPIFASILQEVPRH